MTKPTEPGAPPPLWCEGWYRHARALASPNFGSRPPDTQVSLLVIHSISLPPGEFAGEHVQALFTNQLDCSAHPYFEQLRGLQVSAHFYIRRDGALWQFVSCADRAWHAGASSFGGRPDCNDYSIGIELEGLEGERFEAAQYETLAALGAALLAAYPIRAITGHEHIAPGRKADPGGAFEWAWLARSLGWQAASLPASGDA